MYLKMYFIVVQKYIFSIKWNKSVAGDKILKYFKIFSSFNYEWKKNDLSTYILIYISQKRKKYERIFNTEYGIYLILFPKAWKSDVHAS